MKRIAIALLATFSFSIQLPAEEDWTYLFKDASHVDFYFDFLEETEPEEVFKIGADGTLKIEGKDKPAGYIQTLDEYEVYEIETDWRWPEKAGKSGILIHSDSMPHFGIWPVSFEIQIEEKKVGDFWLHGRKIEVEKEQLPKKAAERNRRKHLRDTEKKSGEWNKMRIVVKSKSISVYLNDKLVNRGKNPSATSGYITIQSEESDIEFRNFRMREIEDDPDDEEEEVPQAEKRRSKPSFKSSLQEKLDAAKKNRE